MEDGFGGSSPRRVGLMPCTHYSCALQTRPRTVADYVIQQDGSLPCCVYSSRICAAVRLTRCGGYWAESRHGTATLMHVTSCSCLGWQHLEARGAVAAGRQAGWQGAARRPQGGQHAEPNRAAPAAAQVARPHRHGQGGQHRLPGGAGGSWQEEADGRVVLRPLRCQASPHVHPSRNPTDIGAACES